MPQPKPKSAWLRLRAPLPLLVAILSACSNLPPVSAPVAKPQNVTADESKSYLDWSQKVRAYLKRARDSLADLTRD